MSSDDSKLLGLVVQQHMEKAFSEGTLTALQSTSDDQALPDAFKSVSTVVRQHLEVAFQDCMKEFLNRCVKCFPAKADKLRMLLMIYESHQANTSIIKTFYSVCKSREEDIENCRPEAALILKDAMSLGGAPSPFLSFITVDFYEMFTSAPEQTKKSILAYLQQLYNLSKSITESSAMMSGSADDIKSSISKMVGMDMDDFVGKAAVGIAGKLRDQGTTGPVSLANAMEASMEIVMNMIKDPSSLK